MIARPEGRSEDELLALTAVRGLAAWWVVLFHLRAFLAPHVPASVLAFLSMGNLAVDFFFILSGFVIYLNYGGRVDGWRSTGDFLFRRFARVYPLHLLMLLGFAAYYLAAAAFGDESLGDQDLPYFAASLLLVQNWGFIDYLAWNVPAWSISVEGLAYLLFPALLPLLAPASRPAWLLAALVAVLGLSVHLFFLAFGYPFPDAVPHTGLFRCLAQFAIGMLLCELYRRSAGGRGAPTLFVAAAILASAWFLLDAPVVPLVWAALVLGLALARRTPLDGAPLVWLGKISYATYLSHYLVLTLFKYLFVEEGRTVAPALLGLYLLAVLIASAALYHGFERPAQRWLLERWKRRSRSNAARQEAPSAAE
jgi:peptidoglycan/LPS O-acetylase OafA/YrhL